MASAVVGLFFLRMWRESRDRLYVMFAAAFWRGICCGWTRTCGVADGLPGGR